MGRSQRILTWTYKGLEVSVNGRGPALTDATILQLAKGVQTVLHS